MNALSINISSVSNLLSIFYGVVANTTKKTIESLQENIVSLQKTNQLIEELAEAIWHEQDIEFANKELKKIVTLHKLIQFSYEAMKVIAINQVHTQTNSFTETEEYIEEYINEFEKLLLGIQSIKNVVENIIRTQENPQKYENNPTKSIEQPIWENDTNERTLETIRKKAWQRTF
jgi:DNA-binding transcriptional regulator YhcF (GntR family)